MIVLDDQLSAPYLKSEIEKWYAGSVIVLGSIRPHGVIKDDNIPALLQDLKQPTFITINYSDFWRKIEAHHPESGRATRCRTATGGKTCFAEIEAGLVKQLAKEYALPVWVICKIGRDVRKQ